MRKNLVLVLVLVLVSKLSVATMAPRFQGELLDGEKISLKQSLRTNKALLLCFWATWCTPCMQELKTISDKMKNETQVPLDILTVNVDTSETSSDVKPTMKLYGFSFPVVLDPKHEIFSKYQESKALPLSILIKPNGEIAKTFSGYNEELFSEIKKLIVKKDLNAKK